MQQSKLARFARTAQYFRCPLCATSVQLQGTSLVCANRHCFDIARQGYVNLVPNAKASPYYSRGSFEQRRTILERGYYAHILDAVVQCLNNANTVRSILDVGCGEGFYSRAVHQAYAQSCEADVLAFDISKESVQLAAREDTESAITWFVANLANLPIETASVDCILDIFSPVNYEEFARVLTDRGVVIKVVPGAQHDVQLRDVAREQLRHDTYDNADVVRAFEEHFEILSRETITRTMTMPYDDIQSFAHMTPLLFNVDIDALDLTRVQELTVEGEVLVGRKRRLPKT